MKNDLIPALLIFLGSIAISLPLTKPGLYVIHDDQQVARLYLFDQALKTGQFPVRWVDALGFGYGYPLFVFYPPLVYMLAEIFHLFGFGFIESVKLVFFISILASGLSMYVLVKEFASRLPAVVSAFFYMYVPYRAIDVYIRGALAESFSFVWLPLILWSFYKLSTTNNIKYAATSSMFLALLLITHNLIFLPFMLLLPFYLLFLVIKSSHQKMFILKCLSSIVISFGLSAFFWFPALVEKKFTIVDQLLLVNLANYNIHFVYPSQLWNWSWGFGGSAAGLADGISFKIGKLHVIAAVITFIFALIHLFKNKYLSRLSTVNCQLSTVFFMLFLFSAFMTTYIAKPVWDLLPPLGYLQFPWRFLTFTALFASILAGAFIFMLRLPLLKLVATTILLVLVIIPNLKLFKPQAYRLNLNDDIATSKETITWGVSSSSFEYVPKGVDLYRGPLGTNLVSIQKSQIPLQKIEIEKGQAQIFDLVTKPSKVEFDVTSQQESKLKANIFNFPGWQVSIDGRKTLIDDYNRLKLITFNVPANSHHVKLEFKNTLPRTTANLLSLFSLFLISFFTFYFKWKGNLK